MKVLIDTNIILDVLCKREPFYEEALILFKLCEIKKIEGIVSALSIPNIAYILRKEIDMCGVKDILQKLSLIFRFSDLKSTDLLKAAEMDFKDYEDSLQYICAIREKADYIVTRNQKDYLDSKVPVISPKELNHMFF